VAVFTASLHQIKHLAIVFRYTYPCASYAAFWHVALLLVSNAVMRNTEDAQWRAYFMFCVNSYADLFGAFAVAGAIVKSLISIGLRLGIIKASEARTLMGRLHENGLHHKDFKTIKSLIVVDLSLAVTDVAAARRLSSDSLEDLILFQEFTELE
jgi:tRNA A-37 threonylcarbamoyl transferase component Bud32